MDRHRIDDKQASDRHPSGEPAMPAARRLRQCRQDGPQALKDPPIPVRRKGQPARRSHAEGEVVMSSTAPSGAARAAVDSALEDFDSEDEPPASSGTHRGLSVRILLVTLALAMLLAIAAVTGQSMKVNALTAQLADQRRKQQALQMQAPGSAQTYRLQPTRARPQRASLNIGRPIPPLWLDLHIDVSTGKYTQFQITIDEIDGGRVMQVKRLARDSNRELRLALNSSALVPGEYLLKIDGHTWRGQLEHFGWLQLDMR